MVPFTGGAFGLARWTFGFHAGFLVGCCESLQYILYVTWNFVQLSRFMALAWPALAAYPYATWIMSYGVAVGALCCGSTPFTCWNRILAFASLGLLLVYVVGAIPMAMQPAPTTSNDPATPNVPFDIHTFLQTLPQAAWFFVGIETLNRLCNEVESPNITIPRSQLWCMLTLFFTALGVFVSVHVLPPGLPAIAAAVAPFNFGYARLFGCSMPLATLLSVPATFASGQGFVQAYTNIIVALGSSRLLPEVFLVSLESTGAPIVAILSGTVLSFALCFVQLYADVDAVLFHAAMLFAFIAYLSQCIGYIYLRREHRGMARPFKSPFGVAGAVVASAVWLVSIAALVGLQDWRGTIFAAAMLALCSVYYKVYAHQHQVFSTQENKALLFAHVARLNSRQSYRRRSIEGFAGELVKLINPPSKYKKSFPPIYKVANKQRQRACKAMVVVAVGAPAPRRSVGRDILSPSDQEERESDAARRNAAPDPPVTPPTDASRTMPSDAPSVLFAPSESLPT
ncbi:hypothetical protein DYB32_004587 [Aphanomyces invadans]|uniref:Amino acid permease/ SLC12A domain-containing protein n=1 Tax=Aphanomyces invadans TaxID=157072 RepID=A0A3R6VM85_9STRA|nr:hypothetical protein DYB32_004587 [Aphanomyces invadans]